MRPILSVRDLSWRLGAPAARLHAIAANIKSHYKILPLPDESRQIVRILTIPSDELKEIQRRIKSRILALFALDEAVHGGVAGRSPRSNAVRHLNQPCVVNLDVKQFFPHVRHYVVYRMFRREFGFGRDVARILTRLTTFDSGLPQGAPTSTGIANLLLTPIDGPISDEAARCGVRYTRFVDDITLSGSNPRPLINVVGRLLSRKRLPMHRKKARFEPKPKLKITTGAKPQEVTGLTVNAATGPSVPRRARDEIRAAIFALRNTTDAELLRIGASSIRGKIAYVRQFNRGAAQRLHRYLEVALAR